MELGDGELDVKTLVNNIKSWDIRIFIANLKW